MPRKFNMAVLPALVLIILTFLAVSLYFSHNIGSQNEQNTPEIPRRGHVNTTWLLIGILENADKEGNCNTYQKKSAEMQNPEFKACKYSNKGIQSNQMENDWVKLHSLV